VKSHPKIFDYYILVYMPNHERAVGDGYVAEQILVAEKILNRSLTDDEEVRHINGNPHDNRPSNLEIISAHADYRSSALQESGEYIPRRSIPKTFLPCKFQRPCWKTVRAPITKASAQAGHPIYLPYICSFQTEGDIYDCSHFWKFLKGATELEKDLKKGDIIGK